MGQATRQAPNRMAETQIKNKPEAVEKAIAFVVSRMPKEVGKRQWSAAAHAALVQTAAENCGAKFTPESKKAFRELMTDSDLSFSSNMKKYLIARGMLPKADEYQAVSFD